MNTARHQIKRGGKGKKIKDRDRQTVLHLTRPKNEYDAEIDGSTFYANRRVLKSLKIFPCRNMFRKMLVPAISPL